MPCKIRQLPCLLLLNKTITGVKILRKRTELSYKAVKARFHDTKRLRAESGYFWSSVSPFCCVWRALPEMNERSGAFSPVWGRLFLSTIDLFILFSHPLSGSILQGGKNSSALGYSSLYHQLISSDFSSPAASRLRERCPTALRLLISLIWLVCVFLTGLRVGGIWNV